MKWNRLRAFFLRESVVLAGYVVMALLVTLQNYLLPPRPFVPGGTGYPHYNNYLIFKHSLGHLLQGQNLYAPYPDAYWDLYKYSPVFPVFMAPFAPLPDWLGLALWNLLNALAVFFGLKHLPYLDAPTTVKIRWFVLVELLTAIQNSQSNALILGLMLGGYICWERARPGWATLLLVAGAWIKPFALLGGLLWFFFPGKGRALVLGLGWSLLLVLLPLALVGGPSVQAQFVNWAELLRSDYVLSAGLSVRGWLKAWFGWTPANGWVVGVGTLLLLLPLTRLTHARMPAFRRVFFASILIWVVIFNHRAESPSFILAMAGVGIWYFSRRATPVDTALVGLTFLFTSLSPTDLFPAILREQVVIPYVLKAVGCLVIWLKITVGLILGPVKPGAARWPDAR